MKKQVRVKSEKTLYTFAYLRNASHMFFNLGKTTTHGRAHMFLAPMLLSAFSMEAYLNHLGSETIPYWATLERKLGPGEKLEILTKHLMSSIDATKRPFHTFPLLFRFRNALVHGRTEHLTADSTQFLSEDAIPRLPEAKWEKMISQRMAERFLADTKGMIQILQANARLEPGLLFTPEEAGWSEEPVN
jgi:hypothetical protein